MLQIGRTNRHADASDARGDGRDGIDWHFVVQVFPIQSDHIWRDGPMLDPLQIHAAVTLSWVNAFAA